MKVAKKVAEPFYKKAGKWVGKAVASKVLNSAYNAGYSRLKMWKQPKMNRGNFITFIGKNS